MTKSSRTRRTTGGPPTSRTGPWWQRTLSKIQNGPGQPQMGGLALLILGTWGMAALLGDLPGHALWRQMCGWGAYPLAVALLAGGLFLLFGGAARQLWRWWLLVGLEMAWLGALTMTQLAGAGDNPQAWAQGPGDGGMVGWIIGDLLRRVFGLSGTWIAASLAIGAGLGLIWFFLPAQVTAPLAAGGSSLWRAAAEGVLDRMPPAGAPADDDEPAELAAVPASRRSIAAPSIAADSPGADKLREGASVPPAEPPAKPRRRSSAPAQSAPAAAISPQPRPQSLPSLDLLVPDKVVEITDTVAREKGDLIERTLASFGVPVEVVEINIGPTVTQFGVKPLTSGSAGKERRVRVSRILALSNDLALALAAPAIRIEAPVPGRPFVGIEVPNGDTTLVTLRGILEAPRFQQIRSPLAIALGRDVSGAPAVADLTRMPHLLVAGATGAGKSVCLNAIVVSLLLNNGPDRLRFLMVDPKMVEMVGYNGIPHLLAPVVIDLKQVVGALVWMTLQMDERYRRFNAAGVRNLEAYNKKVARRTGDDGPLPYLVLIIDELADLMMTAPEDIEKYICRLAQMARATGIHLIIATQVLASTW